MARKVIRVVRKKKVVKDRGNTRKSVGIPEQNIADIVKKDMLIYGTLTVENRAIPDYRDGLKPVHRRVLWAMQHNLNLMPGGGFRKSAKVVGDVMGDYHPHGDLSIYDAMVTLENLADPLIDGQGNWSNGVDKPAAPRYTEARLHKNAVDLLLQPDTLKIIETKDTYDNRAQEPVVFISNLPMSLMTGSEGIAVGTTTCLPCFSRESLQKLVSMATKRMAKRKKLVPVTAKDCYKYLEFKSRYGGNMISPEADVMQLMENGKASLKWQCDYTWDDEKKCFFIQGKAPGFNFTKAIERLAAHPHVKQAADYSDLKGLEIMVVPRPSVSKAQVVELEQAIVKEITNNVSYVVNVTERKRVEVEGVSDAEVTFFSSSVVDIINRWIEWRIGIHKKSLQYQLQQVKKKIHNQKLLYQAVTNLDTLVAMVKRTFKDKAFNKTKELAKKWSISEEDANTIWAISLGRYDRMNAASIKSDLLKLRKQGRMLSQGIRQPIASTADYLNSLYRM